MPMSTKNSEKEEKGKIKMSKEIKTLIDYGELGGYFHPLKVLKTKPGNDSFDHDDVRISILGEDEENGFLVLTIWNHEGGLVYSIREATEEESEEFTPVFDYGTVPDAPAQDREEM